MRYLLDTHLLLWVSGNPSKLSSDALRLIADLENELSFSVASLWEIAIKKSLGRSDFVVDTKRLRRMLNANGYRELAISGEHAIATESLPGVHKDPFDRILIAQAREESLILLTSDAVLASYGDGVQLV